MSSLNRTKTETSKTETQKLVFSGKRLQGTWIMETNLPVPVRRSLLGNQDVMISDNRRIRTLH